MLQALLKQFIEHFAQLGDEDVGGVLLNFVGAEPGFVAAEFVLAGSGKVAVAAIGELDDEGVGGGAELFQLKADLRDDFKGQGADGQVTDADGLDESFVAWRVFCHGEGTFGVGFGEAGQFFLSLGVDSDNFFGALDLFLGGYAVLEGDGALAHIEFGVGGGIFDCADGIGGGIGGFAGDLADLLEWGAAGTPPEEGAVVDIATGAIGHHGDEVLAGATEADGHEAGELAEVVGRHPAADVADVVQRIIGKHAERFLFRIGQVEDGDLGVGRAGGGDEHFGVSAGVHFDNVDFAEGVGRHFVGLQEPAAVLDFVGHIVTGVADAGGLHVVGRGDDGFGDAGDKFFLVGEFLGGAEPGIRMRGAMGVGGGNHHVLDRNAAGFGGGFLGRVELFAVHHAAIDHGHGDAGFAVLQHDAAHVQGIVHAVDGFGEM